MSPARQVLSSLTGRLRREGLGRVFEDEPLAPRTTWRIGGPAAVLLEAASVEAAGRALALAREAGAPVALLGAGSNVLVDDAGVQALVLRLCPGSRRIDIQGTRLIANAGATVGDVALAAARAGLSGLEHAANIPGALGGLLAMNGGSRRQAVGDSVLAVQALDREGRSRLFSREECGFGYRRSVFQENGCLIVGATLELRPDDPAAILDRMARDAEERARKFPLDLPSCGSVFKSDPEAYALHGPPGRIIEDAGLKGLRVGDMRVSPIHANFIVNLGRGSSEQALDLIERVRRRVYERIGLFLACEVRHIAPDASVRPAHESRAFPARP